MESKKILKKLRIRLNKLDSNFSKSVTEEISFELYNKARIQYVMSQLKSEDGNKSIIHRIQALNIDLPVNGNSDEIYTSFMLPKDFLWISNVQCKDSICNNMMRCYLVGNSNVSEKYYSATWQPSHIWCETFYTISNDELKLYKKDFELVNIVLSYYKKPQDISSTVGCIFTEDIVEEIIDLAVLIAASDIGDSSLFQSKASLMQIK